MKDRFSAGKRGIVQQGNWSGGGFIKYGYRYNADRLSEEYTGKLEVDEQEARHLLTMFEKLDSGMKLRQLAQWLHKEGIPAKRGGKWTAQHLRDLLRDRTYIGEGSYGKLTRKGNRFVKSNNTVSMPYNPIIPKDLFERVQDRLDENKRKNNGSTRTDRFYMLQHLGKCGECGGSLLCQTSKNHRYLYCQRQLTWPHIHQCYQPKRWHMDMIEEEVWDEIEGVLSHYVNGSYDSLIEQFQNGQKDREQAITKTKDQLNQCEKERQRILTVLRKGYISEADAEIQLIAINSDQEHWQKELTHTQQLQTDSDAAWQAFMAQLQELDRFRLFGFNHLSAEQKKQLLNDLLKEFVLYEDGKIELRFKLPVNEKKVADTVLTLSQKGLLSYLKTQPDCQQTMVNYNY